MSVREQVQRQTDAEDVGRRAGKLMLFVLADEAAEPREHEAIDRGYHEPEDIDGQNEMNRTA